jgi:hypothetical protein
MKSSVWKRNRGKILIAIAALLIAIAAVYGSGAFFTATATNNANVFAAGTLTLNDGGAAMNVTGLYPGRSATGTLVMSNSNPVDIGLTLSQTAYTDTPGTNGGNLSDVLQIQVDDLFTGSTLYAGPMTGFTTPADLGTFAAGGPAHTIQWTASLPAGADDAYQGSSVSVNYTWTATSQ